ncbi:TetR/AcrR family transcriptional regulator [Streptomyces sp. NPDC088747]|uniref:TetR/AcrR family transcriptional regulator n=1 Tax=Streptomyces sp. NPDC088747 TaxID=3365886 RepID=UPI003816794E
MSQHVSTAQAGGRRARNARGSGDRLRTEILDAMSRLVADEDRMRPVPLSMREVAREAGVTAPAIYRHFADKESLTQAVIDRFFSQLLETLDHAEEAHRDRAPEHRLAALAHAYAGFAQEHPGWFSVMFSDGAPNETGVEQVAARWRTAVSGLAETGLRLSQDPETAAVSVWSSVHGRVLLHRSVGALWSLGDVHTFIDELTRALVTAGPARE